MAEKERDMLPCPFCGEVNEIYPAYRGMGGGTPYAVDCVGCGIDVTPREGRNAIEAWNTRASSPQEGNEG